MKKKRQKQIIGRLELVDFPELGLSGIDAKVDTGAYTSSLHCSSIVVEEQDDDQAWVRFKIFDPDHPNFEDMELRAPVFAQKNVKSSSGVAEHRVFIKTSIRLFSKTYKIELSLTDRSAMKYPVLLGRKILKKRFLVDVSETYLANPPQPGETS